MSDKPQCLWCDKPSIGLCDAVIGFGATGCERDRSGKVLHLTTGMDAEQWTCDAPMCEDHGRQVGWISGKNADSIDRCPHHMEHDEGRIADLVMFAREAESKRRDLYAAIRRARIRAAASLAHSATEKP